MRVEPFQNDSIVVGDARKLICAIPSRSVDLLFADPLYDRIDDYTWLRDESERILTLQGNALAFVNAKWLPRVMRVVQPDFPPLAYVQTSGASPMNGRIIAKTYYLVWWGSGRLCGYMPDGFVGTAWSAPNRHNFKWNKNPKYLSTVLAAFTREGQLVFDPFCGGGSIPAVCKMMNRRYLAFEIDASTVQLARDRLQLTQPPLAGLAVPQMLFDDEHA